MSRREPTEPTSSLVDSDGMSKHWTIALHGFTLAPFMRRIRPLVASIVFICVVGSDPLQAAGLTDWQQQPGFRWMELSVTTNGGNGFTSLLPARTGLNFTNALDELAGASNRVLMNGAGLAAGDYDNDGLPDIFLCSLSGQSALYRNLGNFQFREVTQTAGLNLAGRITRGAVLADLNGDGWLDLLVSTLSNGVACFLNDGHGRFVETTANAGTASTSGSVTMTLADVDGNGTLDLYITNYRGEDIRDRGQVDLQMVKGQMVVPPKLKDRLLVVSGQVLEYGQPDQLLLNDGTGKFTPVSWTGGAFLDEDGKPLQSAPLDWGLTATFRDLNGDGSPDIYVCNDYWTPDRLWLNNGKGQFRAIPRLAIRQTSLSAMGADFADIDRDGHLDFMVTDMLSRDLRLRKRQTPARWPIPDAKEQIESRPQIIQNTLFHNRGDGTYEEIAAFSGVAASEWSWQPVFLDVDLDGYPDLLIPAGHARDVQDMDAERQIRARQHSWKGFTNAVERQKAFTRELMMHMRFYPPLATPIFAFRNRGDLQFEEMTASWGTAQPGVHHSMALADFDGDGDLDLVVNNLNSAVALYRNNANAPRVAVRLKGLPPNSKGIGARIELLGGAVSQQQEEMAAGGRYLSGSEPTVVLAAGNRTNPLSLTVHWRSGRVSSIPEVKANRLYEIDESAAKPEATPAAAEVRPLFVELTPSIGHQHTDPPYDDFARQPLLPKKISQGGPGVAWFDVDGDGWDDLIIGSGRGGQLSVYRNDHKGGFKPRLEPPFNAPVTRDQTAVVGLTTSSNQTLLIVGSSNYEDGLAAGAAARLYDLTRQRLDDSLPGQLSSTGPIALADFDADGDLDVFIGGRCLPGRYPEPASSLLLRQTPAGFQLDTENTAALRQVGLVSAATWSDLDGDGYPELVLACEWGPVRVFGNQGGKLTEKTADLGLDALTGWWSGINTGDLDGDGRLDIVAANWGLNSEYSSSKDRPVRLYFGDLANRGAVDLLEADFDLVTANDAPRRRPDQLLAAYPFLMGRFPTVRDFSQATVAMVAGPSYSKCQRIEAKTLESMVFLNRGASFKPVPLPLQAQLAPAFAVEIADFNGDGFEDIFLSQNFFATAIEIPRLDSGRGLLLLGTGHGQFTALSAQQSGIAVYGEQRGAAVSDYDRDGRLDLAVTQNGAATKIFRNATGKPGLRIRLKGPAGNSTGVGAALRLFRGGVGGPVREIHAGAGYWSQDSGVVVLGKDMPADVVWVRWPGGRATETAVPKEAAELTVDPTGRILNPSHGQ